MNSRALTQSTAFPYLMLVMIWLLLHGLLMFYHQSPVLDGKLIDTDSYMRLVRVGELLSGGGWYDGLIERSNAPYGEILHWTRPFDIVLVAFTALLAPLLGWQEGLFWAGALISPLLQLATALVFIWALSPLLGPKRWIFPLVALFLQPAALPYFLLGRADHHSLLMLVFILTAGFIFRAMLNHQNKRAAFCGGAAAGFGVWMAPELLLTTLACLTALGLAWVMDHQKRRDQNGAFAIGFMVLVTLGFLCEHPIHALDRVFYDQLSKPHFQIATWLIIFWTIVTLIDKYTNRPHSTFGRFGLLAGFGALSGAAVILQFPHMVTGPMAEVDPRVTAIWLDKVTEMRAVLPTTMKSAGEFIYYFGLGLIAVPFLLWLIVSERKSENWLCWCFMLAAIVIYWPLSIAHVRLAPYSETLFVMAVALLLDRLFDWAETMDKPLRRTLIRGLSLYVLIGGSIGLGNLLMSMGSGQAVLAKTSNPAQRCDISQMASFLNQLPNEGPTQSATVLAFIDFGPELLYRSRHQVLATPYHRNGDGIFDSHAILSNEDLNEAQRLAAEREVDYILLCPTSAERFFFSNAKSRSRLYDRLRDQNPPPWLDAMQLPDGLANAFLLYERRESNQEAARDQNVMNLALSGEQNRK
ncbi:MAG: hypothetical protein AAF530_17920 [Pseudomonadota bacterium]